MPGEAITARTIDTGSGAWTRTYQQGRDTWTIDDDGEKYTFSHVTSTGSVRWTWAHVHHGHMINALDSLFIHLDEEFSIPGSFGLDSGDISTRAFADKSDHLVLFKGIAGIHFQPRMSLMGRIRSDFFHISQGTHPLDLPISLPGMRGAVWQGATLTDVLLRPRS